MSLTITIPGAVDVTTGSTAPAVLTIGVGVPGPQGPQGPAGQGVPAGGTSGQYLQKTSGADYATDWVTVNLAAYAVKANNLSDLTNFATARSNLGLGTMATATAADYSTTTAANLLYAPIAAGQPTSGTVGQVLTKNSGTNWDSSWQTLIPGDRYLTTSTTSLTIDNNNKTLTVGTGLSYTSQQDIVIAHNAANHMHARVLTYNSGTGVMDVDVLSHSGSGTYASWTVNVGGAPALASVVWGDITGTLGNQTDLANALNAKLELSGGVLTVNSTIEASTATQLAVFGGSGLNVELTANPSENSVLNYGGLQVQNFSGTMAVTPSGLTFPNASTQTVAYPGSTGFLLKADNLSGLANTGTARTNLGLGTMATATAADYSTTSAANLLYYPLSSNPASYLVAADIAGKAPLADPALTGNVTITTNSADPALVITQDGTGDVVQFKDVASDTTYSFINAVGKVTTIPAVTASAGFNIPHGTAPTTFVDGDIWTTTGGLFARINGSTNQIMDLTTTQTVAGSKTFTNANLIIGSSTAAGTIAIGNGATVSGSTKTVNILTNGAAGSTSSMLIGPTSATSSIEIGPSTVGSTLSLAVGATASGSTKTVNIGTAGQTGSTTNIAIGSAAGGSSTTTLNGTTNFVGPITGAINNITLGNGTAASTYNLFTGATVSGSTKTVAIGTGGLTGSTTNISIGSAAGGTSTTTLNGTTNGVTAAVDTNSVALATTAFVVGQAGSATPLVNGTAAVGTSLRYARQDHVHPTDTTRLGDAPSDGSTYGRNNGAWVVAGGGGGGASTDYQVYTTPGTSTWTKPAGAKWVEIVMFGGGGAGASGGRYATTSGRFGGGGGGGGPVLIAKVAASALGATETVVVGAGGTGGPSTTTDTTLGTAGTQGGSSSFSIFTAIGGNGGTGGGNIGTSPGGTAVVGWVTGVTGASSSAGGTAPATNTAGAQGGSAIVNSFVATGGGSGSGNVANNTGSNNGGNGGQKNASNTTSAGTPLILGGTAGTTAGVAPTTGVTGVGLRGGGTGGGGGAYRTAQAGMAGAVGAAPGGGGGGGSASDNGFASGAGGAGGAGAVYIITYC